MQELGFDDRFEGFVEQLRETHSNRPAFPDEMDKAGLQ